MTLREQVRGLFFQLGLFPAHVKFLDNFTTSQKM